MPIIGLMYTDMQMENKTPYQALIQEEETPEAKHSQLVNDIKLTQVIHSFLKIAVSQSRSIGIYAGKDQRFWKKTLIIHLNNYPSWAEKEPTAI